MNADGVGAGLDADQRRGERGADPVADAILGVREWGAEGVA